MLRDSGTKPYTQSYFKTAPKKKKKKDFCQFLGLILQFHLSSYILKNTRKYILSVNSCMCMWKTIFQINYS